jgi:hypothetical protein
LLNQIDHRQQALPVAAEKLRQPSRVRLSFGAEAVIASLQGGSPFQKKVFQPDSTKNRVENRPLTCNYEWVTVVTPLVNYLEIL